MTYPKAIYHTEGDPHPAAIVNSAEQERAQRIGWGQIKGEAAPAPEPMVGELRERVQYIPDPYFVEETVESLRAKLDAAGKTYDKRWGVDKLRAAL